MRILVGQLNPTIGAFEKNFNKIKEAIEAARFQKADLVVFPEMALCGYPPEDLLLHDSFVAKIEEYLEKVIALSENLFIVLGLVRINPNIKEKSLYNSAAIIHNGKLLGYHDKWLLPTYDVFDERRYFEPGNEIRTWEFKGHKIGVTICEDIWQHAGYVGYTDYACDPILELKLLKPDLLLNITASPYHFKKPALRSSVCEHSARTLQCPVIMCCQVGGNDELVFDGYSIFMNREGKVVRQANGFQEDLMLVDLALPQTPCTITYDPIEDLYHALVLGVRDYFSKLGFQKACLGLSGGIDSALVAVIACAALGKENVLVVAMPSQYNAPASLQDAKELALNLGITLDQIPI